MKFKIKNKNIIGYIVLVLIVIAVIYTFYAAIEARTRPRAGLDQFAQCLASKNITMYGAVWCPHCQKQKAECGASFRYVPYVECPDNEKLCLDKGIKGYPTWIDSNGNRYEGEQSLDTLAKVTQCQLTPQTN